MPLISFYTPRKQKIRGFLMFSGGIERDQWHEMGLKCDVSLSGPQRKCGTNFSFHKVLLFL